MREGSTVHVGSENYSGKNRLVVRSSRTGTVNGDLEPKQTRSLLEDLTSTLDCIKEVILLM